MTLANADVAERFIDGELKGSSNRMDITSDDEGNTYLWDYEWALLGFRSHDGTIHIYNGWYGYSRTTSSHLRLILPLTQSDGGRRLKTKYTKRCYRYGEGIQFQITGSDGAMTMDVVASTASRRVYVAEEDPRVKWGSLKTRGRPELEGVSPDLP